MKLFFITMRQRDFASLNDKRRMIYDNNKKE